MKSERKRIVLSHEMVIGSSAENVFPLLCPVREYEWIPGWHCELVYTDSGIVEQGCVFATDFGDEFGREIWVVSSYEPFHTICFIRTGKRRTTRYLITVSDKENGSKLTWCQEMTALDERGDALIENTVSNVFKRQMAMLEKLLNSFYAGKNIE